MAADIFFLEVCLSISGLLAGRNLIHWFQLESYQFPGYFRTVKRTFPRSFLPGFILGAIWLLLSCAIPETDGFLHGWARSLIFGMIMVGTGFAFFYSSSKATAKKKLVYTARLKRLIGTAAIVHLFLLMLLSDLFSRQEFFSIFFLLLPCVTALDGLLAWPLEKGISELYFRDAQKILKGRSDLIRIGITGSWGKTSVKFILGSLLQEKYNTLITPKSFNTPMGVTKVIRTQLEPGHRIFIAEMGARHVGDIKEMCRLVHPQIGIITSVGPQHLDTFKTIDRVKRTKYELIEALPEDGAGFFADDSGIVLELYQKTKLEKVLAGMNPELDDVWAENLEVSTTGSQFVLCTRTDRILCHTELLGELNIKNILVSAAVCIKLGMSLKEISRGISHLKSVEHRLQLISNDHIRVIDDAFNSNIRGAKQAFDVLKDFPSKRIVVTPGMVELGDREDEMNRTFGQLMAGSCDIAILIGVKRSQPIKEGLRQNGFPEDSIIVVHSLSEAQDYLKKTAVSGDTILFENDLPDNYSEE